MSQMLRSESKKLSDDYNVIDILGRGRFSVARKGISKYNGKRNFAAVKTLKRLGFTPSGFQRNPAARQKDVTTVGLPTWKLTSISDALLTNEILVMRRIVEDVLPRPNVIHLYDVYEDVNGVHLVLELCSGGELFDRMVEHKTYLEVEAAQVVRQMASGLDALKKANIVHHDPENCLFLNNSEHSPLKIIGLSSVEDFTDPIVAMFGSIDYVLPEARSQH